MKLMGVAAQSNIFPHRLSIHNEVVHDPAANLFKTGISPHTQFMNKMHMLLWGVVVALGLSACGGGDPQVAKATLKMEPLPGVPVDPSDYVLKQSIEEALVTLDAPAFSTYEFRRIDLDDDTRRDALVLFRTPYGFWCGQHGCAMMVMKAHDTGFDLVNVIQPIRPPLYVSDQETNGWKTLIARVSGRWDKAKNVEIAYDGLSYPNNPANLETAAGVSAHNKHRVFVD